MEIVCKGRVRHADFKRLYDGRIMRGHYKNGIYHINNLHSQFKDWMYKFHDVSTKFLANYLY